MSWSPDGKRLALVAADGQAGVWDAVSGAMVFQLPKATSPVIWSPDGKTLAADSENNTVQLWSADDGHEIATPCWTFKNGVSKC